MSEQTPSSETSAPKRIRKTKKRVRHFEPRYGVSREMANVEATYVGREHEDYMTLSTASMQQKLLELRGKWNEADQTAEKLVQCLPEREALAFQCLLVRDLFLLMELYSTCLKTKRDELGPQPVIPRSEPITLRSVRALPFCEWLFDGIPSRPPGGSK
jgi:hypothetical protein